MALAEIDIVEPDQMARQGESMFNDTIDRLCRSFRELLAPTKTLFEEPSR
jgi:hypothetical protein